MNKVMPAKLDRSGYFKSAGSTVKFPETSPIYGVMIEDSKHAVFAALTECLNDCGFAVASYFDGPVCFPSER